jgi:colanic acid biosynthesis glycosyl transferase WcaI
MVNPSLLWRKSVAEQVRRKAEQTLSNAAQIGAHPATPVPAPHLPPPPPHTRILFINQYYWPDHASTAQHLTDLAEDLAARGYECHVLTSNRRYQPGEPPLPPRQLHHSVHIHRTPATALGRGGFWKRMTDYLSFYASALPRALLLPRCHLVVCLTTPPIIALLGVLLQRLRGSKLLYWSMDLHPDASIALGRMSRQNRLVRFLDFLAAWVYRQADLIVALGPYMADKIARKGVDPNRIAIVPVWSKSNEIEPVSRPANPLARELGLEHKFVVMYSGNLGLAHSYDEFLAAAIQLKDHPQIVFLFIGGGPRTPSLRQAVANASLHNVRFLDYVPRESLRYSLTLADVHLISMRPEMTGIVVPGKLYGVMAAGRPAIFVGPDHCETADAIREARCGFTIPSGNPHALVQALIQLQGDPNLALAMGTRARAAFLTQYEQKTCCDQFAQLATQLLAKRRARKPNPNAFRPPNPITPGAAPLAESRS